MDFGLVPPEIHAALMYAGPGPGPIAATAAVWDGLAAELEVASGSYGAAVTDLTGTEWLGPVAAGMAASTAPYVSWIHATAAQAAETAAQVKAGVTAYEAAFAATVPPPVIAANRAELLTLIATNIFGQSSAAIAANQAVYAEMWAQNAGAMYGYAAAAAQATRLTPFTPPPKVADQNAPAEQATAAQAVADSSQGAVQQGVLGLPQLLQHLAAPAQAAPAAAVVDDAVGEAVTATAASGLSMGSVYHGAIGSINFFQRIASQFYNQLTSSSAPSSTDLMERMNRIGLATGAIDPSELDGDGHNLGDALGGMFGNWHNWDHWIRGLGSSLGKAFLSAHTGGAATVGPLSVPPAWTAAAPEMYLAALDVPDAAAAAPAAGPGEGAPGLMVGTAAAAALGRAVAGGVGAEARNVGRDRVKEPKRAKPSSAAVAELREVAELLREFGDLRDAGLLTDTEFNEKKRQLMGGPGEHPGR